MTASDARSRITVGDTLPEFSKTFSSIDLFAYGAATWDWARAHYDDAFARSLNFPGPFVDGQHFGALFAQRVMNWLGPQVWITRMKFNFRTMVFIGDTITGDGSVTGMTKENREIRLTIEQSFFKGASLVSACTMAVRLPC